MNTQTANTQKVESGLSKKTVLLYRAQNPVKFETKFGHIDLSLIEDENQKFNGVKDMEMYVNWVKNGKAQKDVEPVVPAPQVEVKEPEKSEVEGARLGVTPETTEESTVSGTVNAPTEGSVNVEGGNDVETNTTA